MSLHDAPSSPAPDRLLLPCRCCYTPTLATQLRPYRYLSQHAFSSAFAHSHCLCPECEYWLHPSGTRTDVWEVADGKDKFCRLCGDGDLSITAVVCDRDDCTFAVCVLCIRANGGERMLREVCRDGHWVCFNHSKRPAGCQARLLDAVDLVCRAERGQFSHRNVFDCFNSITHKPIPSFTYLTPKAKQRWQPPSSPPPSSSRSKRLVSTCLYKWTSSAPKHHVKYLYGLMENLQHFPSRWPGWTLRLYYDNSLILPAAAPEDELDHVHSQSDESPPYDAADNSNYTQQLADAFRLLLSTFANHPSVELLWYNFPYLQDLSHHHHGHVGMAVRFLALAELGVSASHVVVADLDNLWYETACEQAERFEAGKRYHRYHDIDYVFPLAGGSFNARVDRTQPDKPDASPFAEIESHLHAFLTAHHRAPEVLRDSYGERVDESESIAPAASPGASKRVRANGGQGTGDGKQRRKSARVAMQVVMADIPSDSEPSSSGEEEEEESEEDGERAQCDKPRAALSDKPDVGSLFAGGKRLSRRVMAAVERKKEAERRAKREEAQRLREEKKLKREQLLQTRDASDSPHCSPADLDSAKERRDLHHYFFGYSCDQVFLQERVWPVVKQSCATTIIQLEHIRPEKRERNKQEEAAVTELDCDPRKSRCDAEENERRQEVRIRARERGRWQAQKQKHRRRFKHYLGMVDERYFPQHHNIRDWLCRRVREVWSHWRQQGAATINSDGRRSSSWQPRVDLPPTVDIHSLVTAPGHFSVRDEAALARYAQQFSPSAAAAYIGPPSTTSPIDFAARWSKPHTAQKRLIEGGQANQTQQHYQTAHSRQLSFSRADAPAAPSLAPRPPPPKAQPRPARTAAATRLAPRLPPPCSQADPAARRLSDALDGDSEEEWDRLLDAASM